MSVKEEVLKFLESHRATHVSGEEMAEALGVSRTAVWKAVNSLREEGHEIEAVNRLGYRLGHASDVLSRVGIGSHMKYADPERLQVFQETDSTNLRLKAMALEGAPHGTVVVADSQTAGRGRLGRSFVSPSGSGIYLSILLRLGRDMQAAIPVTTAAAVAVCEAVREMTGRDAGIKWVNDVYIGTKKICGILTEAATDFETGSLDYVVVGVGINYRTDQDAFSEDLLKRVGWIYSSDEAGVSRNELAAAIIDRILEYADNLTARTFIKSYREHSVIIGRKIRCTRGNEVFDAFAVDIDENGGLIVDTAEGRRVLSSGEISVRWND